MLSDVVSKSFNELYYIIYILVVFNLLSIDSIKLKQEMDEIKDTDFIYRNLSLVKSENSNSMIIMNLLVLVHRRVFAEEVFFLQIVSFSTL